MNNELNRSQGFFGNENESETLWKYVQSLTPETIAQLSKPDSSEVFQVMERNIIGLLGNLPSEHFGVSINTSRDHLGRLLASAMMSGYFLRNAEQRLTFEKSLQAVDSKSVDDE
ncbi:DUF760 domain-containing protein [Aphanothece sacrum]|uniref:DUF760 domain-containing protein n=1 Tax=Aphanothece sacrum FPU1 TaxID=1920663 RepID=A0A401IGS9_APHSA|nr:DUF760 domain-containing protein [Aphanothece sacrum]GBF80497.1 hypothetical protein AsFPU1_1898 [Aphanothece sacrum FPU1]GBF85887.1 hypothetical protein AsFPU3_2957 [Aphanothece sacrum FPU3]